MLGHPLHSCFFVKNITLDFRAYLTLLTIFVKEKNEEREKIEVKCLNKTKKL
jgi:hypothetical protein